MIKTKPPKEYIQPSGIEVKEMAERLGVKTYSETFAIDLANMAAGGSLIPFSDIRSQIERAAESSITQDPSTKYWKCWGQMLPSKEETINNVVDSASKYHRNVQDFLITVDFGRFQGSPLEQAMTVIKLLSQDLKEGAKNGGGEPGLPIFSEKSDEVAKELHQTMDDVKSLSNEEKELLDVKDSGLTQAEVAEKVKDSKKILEVSRVLDKVSSLKTYKTVEETVNPDGQEVRQRPLESLSELDSINPVEWAMYGKAKSLFMYRAITSSMDVTEKIDRFEKKQAIFLLVDGSGSMGGDNHLKATGIAFNRLKDVQAGNAEIFISVFDTSMHSVKKASTPEEAKTTLEWFRSNNFSGGGTDITAAVKAAHRYIEERIKEGALLYKPQVIVVTDDDSSASGLRPQDIPGTVVHGFAVNNTNPSLKKACVATGGVCFEKL